METTELRTACKLKKNGRAVAAAIHLIEIRYSEGLVFWNGVCQVTGDDVPRAERLSAQGTPFEVLLPDGRTGFLHVVRTHWEAGCPYEIAGVGIPNEAAPAVGRGEQAPKEQPAPEKKPRKGRGK